MSVKSLINRKPWILALIFAGFLILWMISGFVGNDGVVDSESGAAKSQSEDRLTKEQLTLVRAERRSASSVAAEIALHGKTEASRKATLTAETQGRIEEIVAQRGQYVAQGQVLIRLAKNDRELKLSQAQALLNQRELEFQGARKLNNRGFNAEAKLAEARQLLEAAKVELERQRLDLQFTEIKAPFAGVFNQRDVELGDYVSIGQRLGVLLDVDPVIVRVDVPELDMAKVHLKQQGKATLITGEEYSGQVRFVSQESSDATHTFRVELAIDNPERAIPIGISSSVSLISSQSSAHKISPALLSLSKTGDLGIKVVGDDNRVQFAPVSVVKTESDGIWISGLQKEIQLITVGQGFVSDGDKVNVDLVNDNEELDVVDGSQEEKGQEGEPASFAESEQSPDAATRKQ